VHNLSVLLQSWGPAGTFLLAFIDSAGIPLPGGVDALILLVSGTNHELAWVTATVSVVGSMLGNVLLFMLARKGGQMYLDRHTATPRSLRLRDWFSHYGLLTVFVPALIPIPMPLKVFVISAGALGVRLRAFLLVLLAARIPRCFALAYLGRHLGEESIPWLKSHLWEMAGLAGLLFAIMFLTVWILERRRLAAQLQLQ